MDWRDILGYEGLYQVSDCGQVRSLDRWEWSTGRHEVPVKRKRAGKLKSTWNGPYKTVSLCRDGKTKGFLVHRLVAIAFLPNTEGLPEVNHLDEDKYNNTVGNLQWCDSSSNSKHSSYKTTGSRCGTSKLVEKDVKELADLLLSNLFTLIELGDLYGVTNHAIFRIKAGKNWAWLTGFGKEDTQYESAN